MTSSRSGTGLKPTENSKAEVAYERIRSQIINGIYGPGYRLVLDRLAAEIGVSAVPIREALRRLEAEGYVDFQRNVGATVSQVDAAGYVQTMETLAILEASATALAAPHVTKRDIRKAQKINEAMATSLEQLDPLAFTRLNQELHETLLLACPNTYLVSMVQREWSRLRGLRRPGFSFVPARARRAMDEHSRLIELIDSGASPARIEDYARTHRMRTVRLIAQRAAEDTTVEPG